MADGSYKVQGSASIFANRVILNSSAIYETLRVQSLKKKVLDEMRKIYIR